MTRQTTEFSTAGAQGEAQIQLLRNLLDEMEALLRILPAAEPDHAMPRLPTEEEVEASFDNMPV
jgi:hypothetical protein